MENGESNYYMTRGVQESFDGVEISYALSKFLKNDFGDICEEDNEVNNFSRMSNTGMIMGVYNYKNDRVLWVIQHLGEGGYTTVLLPSEY